MKRTHGSFLCCFKIFYFRRSRMEYPMVPSGIFTPKSSAMVAPMMAKVSVSGSSPLSLNALEYARNRDTLAGVVGSGVGRVISVVRGDDEKIIFAQSVEQYAQIHIEFLNLLRVAGRISPMAPQGIEVDQVHKAETVEVFLCHVDGLLHAMHGALGLVSLSDALSYKDIIDLSDGNDIISCIL